MSYVLTLRIPAPSADDISERIWREQGILGIQEGPLGGAAMFPMAEGFEVLEFGSEAAKKCAAWLEKESFRSGAELLLQVYLDPTEEFSAPDFVRALNAEGFVAHQESYASLEDVDYLENYKRSVVGTRFGKDLWIGPPWAEIPGDVRPFIVEPGLAFGTGGHPTTQLCFERLEALSHQAVAPSFRSFLDLGTGTGILGVAVKTFFPNAELVVSDLDPLCRDEVAKTFTFNGRANSIPRGYFGPEGSAAAMAMKGYRFDVVVSNIYAEVLCGIVSDVAGLLPVGGRWIVSGILAGSAANELLRKVAAEFDVVWTEARQQESSQLDSAGGFRAIQETWLAHEFVKKRETKK